MAYSAGAPSGTAKTTLLTDVICTLANALGMHIFITLQFFKLKFED